MHSRGQRGCRQRSKHSSLTLLSKSFARIQISASLESDLQWISFQYLIHHQHHGRAPWGSPRLFNDNYQGRRICETTLVAGNETFQLMTHPLLFLKNTPTIPLTSSDLFVPVKPFNPSFLSFSFLCRVLPFLPGKPGFRLRIDIFLPFSVFHHISGQNTAIYCSTVCLLLMACSIIDQSLLGS